MCVCVFSTANESVQVRLGLDKTQLLDSIQTGENGGCGCSGKEKEIKSY